MPLLIEKAGVPSSIPLKLSSDSAEYREGTFKKNPPGSEKNIKLSCKLSSFISIVPFV